MAWRAPLLDHFTPMQVKQTKKRFRIAYDSQNRQNINERKYSQRDISCASLSISLSLFPYLSSLPLPLPSPSSSNNPPPPPPSPSSFLLLPIPLLLPLLPSFSPSLLTLPPSSPSIPLLQFLQFLPAGRRRRPLRRRRRGGGGLGPLGRCRRRGGRVRRFQYLEHLRAAAPGRGPGAARGDRPPTVTERRAAEDSITGPSRTFYYV